jgi:hypothetical protein
MNTSQEDYPEQVAVRCHCLMKQTRIYREALQKMRVMTAGGMLKNLDTEELDNLAIHTMAVCQALETAWLEKLADKS